MSSKGVRLRLMSPPFHVFPAFIFWANLLIGSHVVPTWITDEAGKRTQERVWNDLLKRLDSSGHSIDLAALKAGSNRGMAT